MIQLVYGINFSIRQISVGESAPPKPKCVPFYNCFAGSNFHFSLFRLHLMQTALSLSLSSWRSVFTELPATAGFDQIFNVQLLSLISVWSKLFWSVGVISFQECIRITPPNPRGSDNTGKYCPRPVGPRAIFFRIVTSSWIGGCNTDIMSYPYQPISGMQ